MGPVDRDRSRFGATSAGRRLPTGSSRTVRAAGGGTSLGRFRPTVSSSDVFSNFGGGTSPGRRRPTAAVMEDRLCCCWSSMRSISRRRVVVVVVVCAVAFLSIIIALLLLLSLVLLSVRSGDSLAVMVNVEIDALGYSRLTRVSITLLACTSRKPR